MTEPNDLTLGEIGRSVARIEATITSLSNQVQTALAPIAEVKVKVERCEVDINALGAKITALDEKVDTVKSRNDVVSGASASLAIVGAWLVSWFHK
jgi:peptidoglycan hydrolase CwlO-like protein